MTSEEELQQQLNDLAEEHRQRTKPLRTIVITALLGGVLAALAAPAIILLDTNGVSLATGIRFIDSMLYSIGSGPMVLVLLSIIWAIPGAISGFVLGCFCAGCSAIVQNTKGD